jgi:hypothetical protein
MGVICLYAPIAALLLVTRYYSEAERFIGDNLDMMYKSLAGYKIKEAEIESLTLRYMRFIPLTFTIMFGILVGWIQCPSVSCGFRLIRRLSALVPLDDVRVLVVPNTRLPQSSEALHANSQRHAAGKNVPTNGSDPMSHMSVLVTELCTELKVFSVLAFLGAAYVYETKVFTSAAHQGFIVLMFLVCIALAITAGTGIWAVRHENMKYMRWVRTPLDPTAKILLTRSACEFRIS